MKVVVLQQKSKYAYGYKFNEERMQKQMIMLPVYDNNTPDWDYMEQYARVLFNRLKLLYLQAKTQRGKGRQGETIYVSERMPG